MPMEEEWIEVARHLEKVGRFCRLAVPRWQGLPLSGAEVDVLTHLALAEGDATASDIAHRTGMCKESVSRLVAGLGRKGLLARMPHPRDGRSLILSLTDAGRGMLESTYEQALAPIYAMRDALGPQDFSRLMLLLDRASDSLDDLSC